MRRSFWRFLAAASLMLAPAGAADRPRYGDALRMEIRAAIPRLDPAADDRLAALVFEGLVRLDEKGRPQPSLALSWRRDAANKRWQFELRGGVQLHDGSLLTPGVVAAALEQSDSSRTVRASGASIVIQSRQPMPGLLWELARKRNAIAVRTSDEALVGTGPFRVAEWEPGRRALLAANENYWGGRPFLDAVEIQMGRPFREQMIDLELGRVDVVEISPGEMRGAAQRGWRIWSSAPVELWALVFNRGRAAVQDARVRESIGLSVDRPAIHAVLLQKQGEPAGSLLPQWLSGYAFLFPTVRSLDTARGKPPARQLSLVYDPSDTLARVVAERIALNARDAGITLRVSAQSSADDYDVLLARARIHSTDPGEALIGVARALGWTELPNLDYPAAAGSLYEAELGMLEGAWVIPLFHLPDTYGLNPRVKNWMQPGTFRLDKWRLENVWLAVSPEASAETQR
jgi:peptide/nickel transport system substrate-binding protein